MFTTYESFKLSGSGFYYLSAREEIWSKDLLKWIAQQYAEHCIVVHKCKLLKTINRILLESIFVRSAGPTCDLNLASRFPLITLWFINSSYTVQTLAINSQWTSKNKDFIFNWKTIITFYYNQDIFKPICGLSIFQVSWHTNKGPFITHILPWKLIHILEQSPWNLSVVFVPFAFRIFNDQWGVWLHLSLKYKCHI